MSADLHLHAMDTLVEEELAEFFSRTWGSKYFCVSVNAPEPSLEIFDRVARSPNVWIGEVSWLKAAFRGDGETYVPAAVSQVFALIGEERPVLTEELAGRIVDALRAPNATSYRVAGPDDVQPWLASHMGSRLFTVSW